MKIKNILLTLFVLLISLFCLFSCGKPDGAVNDGGSTETGEEIQISPDDYFKFAVVYNAKSTEQVAKAAEELKNAIENASGEAVYMTTDDSEEWEYEIIVGYTKRAAYKPYSKLSPKSFVIDHVGKTIVINGATYKETVDAVNYFIKNYISSSEENTVTLAEGQKYEYEFVYPELIVNGLNMKDYALLNCDGLRAEWITGIRDRIKDVFGFEMMYTDTPAEKNVYIKIDAALGEGKYKNYADGESVYITGGDYAALGTALSEFSQLIPTQCEEGEKAEITVDAEGRTVPSILKDINNTRITKYFHVETDKNPIEYSVGDVMTFDISLLAGGELRSVPGFRWSVSPEGGAETTGMVPGGSGKLTLTASMDKPGFVFVTVYACDENGEKIEGIDRFTAGACANIEDIKVTVDEPDDWEEFWDKQIKRLDAVKPVAIDMVDDNLRYSHDVYDVKIACPGNEKWTGETYSAIYVSIPKNAEAQTLGIYVKFMGAGVRTTESHLSYKEDYICVSVNGHSIPSRMDIDYYDDLSRTTLASYAKPKDENEPPEEVFYSYMVMRDLQALRWVKDYYGERGEDLWDGKRLEVSGMSEGGYQALFTAALDEDVSFCTADVPAMCDKQGVTIGRKGGYGSTMQSMLYYDTCYFARRIKCPTKIMVGLGDDVCVPSSITAMYNELTCEKEIVYVQNMGHAYPNPNKVQEQFTLGGIAEN